MGKAPTKQESITLAALRSAAVFVKLIAHHSLRLKTGRIGKLYRIDGYGSYAIFRETVNRTAPAGEPGVLVVGFRLKLLRSNPALHWLFQRVCIFTTPFWSGFRGFRIKLWMVDPKTKNYLGIYEWAGEGNARHYVETLIRVLRPLSSPGSVWYKQYPGQSFEQYLDRRAVKPGA